MVKINNSTIKNIIDDLVFQKNCNMLTLEYAWQGIQGISYCSSRMKSVLEYYAVAEFDPKDEKVTGNIFEFISEYCSEVSQKSLISEHQSLRSKTNISGTAICLFIPQDIGVVIENVVSNSCKNNAKEIVFNMYSDEENYCIDIIDNGDGLTTDVSLTELFEFGKSYTKHGTGVGLFHVKEIIKNMCGQVVVNPAAPNGFELNVRFKK